MKVLITSGSFGRYDDQARQLLLQNNFELLDNPYGHIMNEQEFSAAIAGVDAVILGTEILNEQVLRSAGQLQFVSRYGVGVDNIDLAALKERKIALQITRNCNHEAVADFTIGLMLDTMRGISRADRSLRQKNWKKSTGLNLYQKKVGVIGLGAIGKAVIRRLSGFQATIYGYDLQFDTDFCQQYAVRQMALEEIYQTADVITLHLPALPEQKPLIGWREISMMKKTAILINTARASLVDDNALIKALAKQRIFGAGIDAPLCMDELDARYLTLDNLVVTPHNAAVSVEASNRMSMMAAEHIIQFFAGNTKKGDGYFG